MARPTIVIGLGGTGQWVLTFLKKALLETYQGKVPSEVKLLSFDTMAAASVATETSVQGQKDIRVGDVTLERNVEFIPLAGNSYEFARGVANGRYPHVETWFNADYYLREASQALFDLAAGAAQIRQFGRLAFFLKVNTIWERIRRSADEIRQMASGKRQIDQTEILIVASFAGGTGAGMFVDMGVLSRRIAQVLGGNTLIRGFFVLPTAFGSVAGIGDVLTHMQARSFAAWRELDRFMSMREESGRWRLTYVENSRYLDVELRGRPFDIVYLVDAFREAHSLQGQPPERGIFPALAEFLAAIIDDKTGPKFTEHTINILGDFDKRFGDRGARYSAFTTYTLKVPVYYAQQNVALELVYKFLREWLAPEVYMEKGVPIVRGVKTTANREATPGDDGRRAALRFFKGGQVRPYVAARDETEASGEALAIPSFLHMIAELGDPDVNAIGDAKRIRSFAQSLSAAGLRAFADMPMEGIPARYQPLRTEQRRVWEPLRDIQRRIPPSKGFDKRETPTAALSRFQRQVSEFFANHFGENGAFPQFLERVEEFQVAHFQDILAQKMLWILNGENAMDPRRAKGGKIGFARDFLAGLAEYLDNFVTFLDRVQQERAELQLETRAREQERKAFQRMAKAARKKCLFRSLFTHPEAWATQRLYLDAVSKRAKVEADDRLLASARSTAVKMRAIALSALDNMDKWIAHLATGDEAQNTRGLLVEIWEEQRAVQAAYEADKSASETQMLLEMEEYQRQFEDELEKLLSNVVWNVEYGRGKFDFTCALTVTETRINEDGDPYVVEVSKPLRRSLQDDKRLLKEAALRYFSEWPRLHYVVDELRESGSPYSNPEDLRRKVQDYLHPFLRRLPNTDKEHERNILFIRGTAEGSSAEAADYLEKLRSSLAQADNSSEVELWGSEDSHRLVFVRSYDNVLSIDFQAWYDLRGAYLHYITRSAQALESPQRLHIFPAEVNAIHYEQKLEELLGKDYRPFHPRVVMLLQQADRLSLFFRAYAQGWIKLETIKNEGKQRYVFAPPYRKSKEVIRLTDYEESTPKMFEVVQQFVLVGKDIKRLDYIQWDDLQRELSKAESAQGNLRAFFERTLEQKLFRKWDEWADELIDRAKRKGARPREGVGWLSGQEYKDLADVGRIMYRERLENTQPLL